MNEQFKVIGQNWQGNYALMIYDFTDSNQAKPLTYGSLEKLLPIELLAQVNANGTVKNEAAGAAVADYLNHNFHGIF